MDILPLLELAQKAEKSRDRRLYTIFTDFNNAFSSVSRPKLFAVLREYNVPERFVAFLQRSHAQQKLRVRVAGCTHSEYIVPDLGVMQGDTLAPYLFILIIDQILRGINPCKGALVDSASGLKLPALAYADDVALLANSENDAQELLTAFEKRANSFGLTLNTAVGKTEVMVFAPEHERDHIHTDIHCLAGAVGRANKYRYLGYHVDAAANDSWARDFALRERNAWIMARKHGRIWTSHVSATAKKRLFQQLILPLLLYGAAAYPQTLQALRRVHVACNKLLRFCLRVRIHWDDPELHVPVCDLYSDFPCAPVQAAISLIEQWGHWVRLGHRSARGHSRMMPPVVGVLTGELSDRRCRGKTWPPSRSLATIMGPTVCVDWIQEAPAASPVVWKRFVAQRQLEYAHQFVDDVVRPFSLFSDAVFRDWPATIAAWFNRKARNQVHGRARKRPQR